MSPPSRSSFILVLAIFGVSLAAADDYEEAPILYSTKEPKDRIAELTKQIEAGTFEFDRSGNEKTYLRSVLKTLNVPEASQVLVYSKTSKQNDRISPKRPRAIYYSDEFYVGWVQGGDIEIVSTDPELGPVFYLLEVPRSAEQKSLFVRDNDCLRCHAGMTRNRTPGLLVRSVFTDDRGFPILTAGTHFTEHTSPMEERWGGWYVTGNHGDMRHMGNIIAVENEDGSATFDKEAGANLQDLTGLIDTTPYIRNDSDIVSLKALLFTDEFQLEGFGVEGSDAFAEAFQANAKRTKKGKSLKDLQLLSHLFKNRCSYMIYSVTFTNLPKPFKDIVFEKLENILTAETPPEDFQHISAGERRRIHEILSETLEGFPQKA